MADELTRRAHRNKDHSRCTRTQPGPEGIIIDAHYRMPYGVARTFRVRAVALVQGRDADGPFDGVEVEWLKEGLAATPITLGHRTVRREGLAELWNPEPYPFEVGLPVSTSDTSGRKVYWGTVVCVGEGHWHAPIAVDWQGIGELPTDPSELKVVDG